MRGLLLGLLVTVAVSAETYVVAAGIEQYDDPQIAGLRYAVRDVTAVAASLAADDDHLIRLTSDAGTRAGLPTKFNILHALQRVRERARAGDSLVFFFAGHGMEQGGEAYLLTQDSIREQLAETALPMSVVHAMMRGFEAEQVLFIIDACRNDPEAGRAQADAQLDESFARGLRPVLTQRGEQAPTTALLLACEVGERAWEMPDEQHGAFTWFLLRGLAGEARDADGNVRLKPLAAYLQREVPAWARRAGRQQTPHFDNPSDGDFVLVSANLPAVQTPPRPPVDPPTGPAPVVTQGAPGERPANWPAYLENYQPAAGRTWADYRVHGPDGMPQVRIPAGVFVIGSEPGGAMAASTEMPRQKVGMSEYWMDLHEVTNEQFAIFCKATGHQADGQWDNWVRGTGASHPAVFVSWDEAQAYADWAGRELPSEAQWERAARADTESAFPWGDRGDPSFGAGAWTQPHPLTLNLALRFARPVGSFAPNAFGLFDTIGNVREWCRDKFADDWYQRIPGNDPVCDEPGIARSIRGGGWADVEANLRPAVRRSAVTDSRSADVGFRLVAVK